jgi:hypothetical protein
MRSSDIDFSAVTALQCAVLSDGFEINEMRIWSLHPSYLDAKGLVALWRETLLAQKVLLGETVGYRNHPQLIRFKDCGNPVGAIATYLRVVAEEASSRGYRFDMSKICRKRFRGSVQVTSGQVQYELAHLLRKLKLRDKQRYLACAGQTSIAVHPLFAVTDGDVEPWEAI